MKNPGWFSPVTVQRIAGSLGLAVLMITAGAAAAQDATTSAQPTAPNGYTLHESIDLGGHVVGINGSGAMYDTMVNLESGPRVLGETFELHALPGAKHTLVDSLSAFSNGWGGDPDNYARINFFKGNLYEFSGNFFRDRQYFDYDLLGNPNIPFGQSLPVSGSSTPYAWPQVDQSPFLYNTARRRTNVNLTIFPVSKLSYQAGYSQDVFQGPSLTPSGYQFAGSYDVLLQEMQRNSTDDFTGEVDWKPVPLTRLTFEEVVDHYKNNSYFTMDPSYFRLQEQNGARVALLANYDSLAPTIACNAAALGSAPSLSAPSTPGGAPIINPACGVISSYFRSAPTRILYPTEIFRFQSSSLRNISMNGDIRYTKANMSLPLYQDIFQGFAGATVYQDYTATATAKREVTAVDYAAEWRATRDISFEDQFTFSNEQEPGISTMTSLTTSALTIGTTAAPGPCAGAGETINCTSRTTTFVNTPINSATGKATSTFEGSGAIATPVYDFFGQRFITNDLAGTWDGWPRATLSLAWRHVNHVIAEGIPHDTPLALGATNDGTVTI
ncbi:MAG TPA: hypothetical protein VMD29_05270, partial [Terracidiphilus sp.]|nr:hypothetical protein [Terracidiphilus sp.]